MIALAATYGADLQRMTESRWLPIVRDKAIAMMMEEIKGDLAALGQLKGDLGGQFGVVGVKREGAAVGCERPFLVSIFLCEKPF